MLPDRFVEIFSRFKWQFLGIGLIHAWLQVMFYESYRFTDGDSFSTIMNVVRVLTMLVVACYAGWVTSQKETPFEVNYLFSYISTAAMMIASCGSGIFYLLGIDAGYHVCKILGALGVAWGGGMWVAIYKRLSLPESLFYTCVSISLGSVVGFFLSLCPEPFDLIASVLLPLLACFWFVQAEPISNDIQAHCTTPESERYPFDSIPFTSFIPVVIAIVIFGFALGISRAYPAVHPYDSVYLFTFAEQVLHRFGTIICALFLIWWVLIAEKRISFKALWGVLVAIVTTGIFILSTPWSADSFALTLTTLANTCALPILWFTMLDIARSTTRSSVCIVGIGWSAYILSRNIGKAVATQVLAGGADGGMLMSLVSYLVSMSLVFVLTDKIGGVRELFSGLSAQDSWGNTRSEHQFETPVKSVDQTFSELQELFGLTPRETEVAQLTSQGRSKSAIAEIMGLSENTVRSYAKSLYKKLDVHSKQEFLDVVEEVAGKPARG